MKLFLISLLFLIESSSLAGTSCNSNAVEVARRDIGMKLKANLAKEASEIFIQMHEKCSLVSSSGSGDYELHSNKGESGAKISKMQINQYFWLISDGLLALKKANHLAKCASMGSGIINSYYHNPFQDLEIDKSKVGKAIIANTKACRDAWEEQFAEIPVTACPLKLDGRKGTSYLVPANFLPKGMEATCIGWVSDIDPKATAEEKDMEVLRPDLTPHLRLILKSSDKEGVVYQTISLNKALSIFDSFFTCGISQFRIQKRDGKSVLRLTGDWSPCFGGTANGEIDAALELTSSGVKLLDAIEGYYH